MRQLQLNISTINNLLIVIAIFTISFDIFLVFTIGFNFRISQLLLFIPFLHCGVIAYKEKSLTLPIGFRPLLIWTLFIVLFIPNSASYIRGFGYSFWLLNSVVLIVFFVNYFENKQQVSKLFRVYIYSYLFVAVFGLVQFLFPLMGFPGLLVTQWWIPGEVPRINGFSYEPSYFATYMIMGFVITGYLMRVKSRILTYRNLQIIHYLILLVLMLCSSRMGWAMVLLWYLSYPIFFPPKILRGKLRLNFLKRTVLFSGVSLAGIILIVYMIGFQNIRFLLSGLGIGELSAHSTSGRVERMVQTLQVFVNHPLIGVSLGGVGPHIAVMSGYHHLTFDVIKDHEGMMVFAEILAASGIFGVIPFVLYLYKLFSKPIDLLKKTDYSHLKHMLGALVWALLFELIILQFNQNILRPFLWMHIAILSAVYNVSRMENNKVIRILARR